MHRHLYHVKLEIGEYYFGSFELTCVLLVNVLARTSVRILFS